MRIRWGTRANYGKRTLGRLLEAVKADVEFGGALRAVGRVPRPPTDVHRREPAHNDDRGTEMADETGIRELEGKELRAHRAAWERFTEAELRETRCATAVS